MSGGGGIILNGGVAAAVSAVLVALIQSRSLVREKESVVPPEDPALKLRRQLLEFADVVDAEAEQCADVAAARRLFNASRKVRSRLLE